MKQILSCVIVIFSIQISYVKAQEHKLELGLEGGPNQSGVSGKGLPFEVGPSYNYSFGFAGQYNISDQFFIKASINNELKGFSQTFAYVTNPKSPEPFDTYKDYTGLQYITIPIMAKLSFGSKSKFFVNAGPYFGFRVGTQAKISYPDTTGNLHTSSEGVNNLYKTIDFGASMGLGLEMPISEYLIVNFEARYNAGLVNIDNTYFYNFRNESADLLIEVRCRI